MRDIALNARHIVGYRVVDREDEEEEGEEKAEERDVRR